jgi:DNA-binding response OmpR family regulator
MQSARLRPDHGRVRTILVVEDNPAVRTIVCLALKREGYAVLAAGDIAPALARAASHDGTVDLVVVDVRLPGGNGMTLVDRMLAAGQSPPVLYLSGWPQPPAGLSGKRTLFLAKPFAPHELAWAVSRLLDD